MGHQEATIWYMGFGNKLTNIGSKRKQILYNESKAYFTHVLHCNARARQIF